MLQMFLCLGQNSTELVKLGFDRAQNLADVVRTFLNIERFKANRQ